MAIIRPEQNVTWETMGRDKYLRSNNSPILFDDPVTARGIRGGQQVISQSGNVMPRSITRDKLGQDALLFSMNINADSTSTIMVATGYDPAINNYIYAVTWNGVDYNLIRFNTQNLLSPYEDAYSVNLPVDSSRDNILGVTVLSTQIAVLVQVNNSPTTDLKILYYDFSLNYSSSVVLPSSLALATAGFTRNFVYDSKYFVHSISPNVRQTIYQPIQTSWSGLPLDDGQHFAFQKFVALTDGHIKRFSVYLKNPNTGTGIANFDLASNIWPFNSHNLGGLGAYSLGPNAGPGWYHTDVDIAVTKGTTYVVFARGAPVGPNFSANWGTDGNNYPGGYFIGNAYSAGSEPAPGTDDATFICWQTADSSIAGKIIRYDPTTYDQIDSYSWPSGTQPDNLLAYDKKFYYGYDPGGQNIVKFAIQNGAIVIASTQSILETVLGIMWFNSFLYIVYTSGSKLVAVPVSI